VDVKKRMRDLNFRGLAIVAVVGLSIALAISLFYRGLEAAEANRCGPAPDAACVDAEHWQELAATAK